MTEEILVLTTGGTIDKEYFDTLSAYQIGEPMVRKLLATAKVTHPVRVVEVLQKDSLEIDDADRARIAEIVAAESATRIVITHGTDTMTRTAEALRAIEGKTIALVGAWTPARFAESDAAFNLGMAFACAQLAAPGIYVAMNGSIFPASAVAKDREIGSFIAQGGPGS